jgi:hypothetical protein
MGLANGGHRPQLPTMNTIQATPAHADLTSTRVLAALLQRLDSSEIPVDAQQYQTVVDRLSQAFRDAKSNDDLGTFLDAYPAAAELYENTHYQVAGLCRSPLDASLAAERQAVEIIQRAMQSPKESSANGQS